MRPSIYPKDIDARNPWWRGPADVLQRDEQGEYHNVTSDAGSFTGGYATFAPAAFQVHTESRKGTLAKAAESAGRSTDELGSLVPR